MRPFVYILLIVLFASFASAKCIDALDGMRITNDTTFCSDAYDVPNGIHIMADNITIDCGTAVLRGDVQEGTGIIIENRKNVVIRHCNILTFHVGIYLKNSSSIVIDDSALLKNRIGIRMLNANENFITNIADKSTQTPVSLITSKFNTFDINKRIDEAYCISNLCNEIKDINPCVDDDFYCSQKCTAESDNDCVEKVKPVDAEPKENKTEEPVVVNKTEEPETMTVVPKKKSKSWLLYPIFYILAFLFIQFYEHVKED
ncbi:hypothetical protein KY333_03925 [Candidatus Woesearchaeota archaeon]|nr:hypothetical protein [Candidatus Woesearchaeota archaeon]MBW2994482.1 hypothetical protein [Candidatus Woesearchaeota archaeon]